MENKFGSNTLPALKRLGGYTLVEMLPTVIIWGVLTAALFPIVYDYWMNSAKVVSAAETRRDIERALRAIDLSVAYATNVSVTSNKIVVAKAGKEEAYEYSQGVLYHILPNGDKHAIVEGLSEFSATYTDVLRVQLQFGGERFVLVISPR